MIRTNQFKLIHRWLDTFSFEQIDEIMSAMIRLYKARSDTEPRLLFGKITEADYTRLKLHYFIEEFTNHEAQHDKHTISNLRVVNYHIYKRLIDTAELGQPDEQENYGGSS